MAGASQDTEVELTYCAGVATTVPLPSVEVKLQLPIPVLEIEVPCTIMLPPLVGKVEGDTADTNGIV